MRRGRVVAVIGVAMACAALACANLVDIPDRFYQPDDAATDGPGDGSIGGDDRSQGDDLGADRGAIDQTAPGDDGTANSDGPGGNDATGDDGSTGPGDGTTTFPFGDACPACTDSGLCLLACNQNHPTSIAVDPSHVFWTNEGDPLGAFTGGAVMQADLSGANLQSLVPGLTARPSGITTAGGCVYWIEYQGGNTIRGYCSGTTTSVLANSGAVYFAIAGTTMVWATSGGGSDEVVSCTLPGCTNSKTLAVNRFSPRAPAINTQYGQVYWLEPTPGSGGQVITCSLSSCTPSSLAALAGDPQSLAVDSMGDVLFTSGTAGRSDGIVYLYFYVAGTLSQMAFNRPFPVGVVTDGQNAYWAEPGTGAADGQIVGCPLAFGGACTVQVFADHLTNPTSVAIDSTSVYWVNRGPDDASTGSVMSAKR
jgi:hypothetical protein